MIKETAIIGGKFTENSKQSVLINRIASLIPHTFLKNGVNSEELPELLQKTKNYSTIFWLLEDKIRKTNSESIIITWKNNNNKKYFFNDLLNQLISDKADLCIEVSKPEEKLNLTLFDSSGNIWYKGTNIFSFCNKLKKRIDFLHNLTKIQICKYEYKYKIDNRKLYSTITERAPCEFYNIINNIPTLESASFRSIKRSTINPEISKKVISVLNKDLNTKSINEQNFTGVSNIFGKISYEGEQPPKIDAQVQFKLYEKYCNINYIIRSHYYIKTAPFTKTVVPSGVLEEFEQIQTNPNIKFYAINLYGNGSIILANDLRKLNKIEYTPRPVPEIMF